MPHNFYPQSTTGNPPTLTVTQLIEKLQQFPGNMPVLYRSPETGAFGPKCDYTLLYADKIRYDKTEKVYKAYTYIDDDTGEKIEVPEYRRWMPAFEAIFIR